MAEYTKTGIVCPLCDRIFPPTLIQEHAERCLFLSAPERSPFETAKKKTKLSNDTSPKNMTPKQFAPTNKNTLPSSSYKKNIPLSEEMRPKVFSEYIGQDQILGDDKLLRQLIMKKDVPSMILWGPPGCGKTSLANLIACLCEKDQNLRFVKLSATMSGVNDVKEIIKVAKNEEKFKRKTILFMDEIHRFNKLQQDTFLPHIENGTIILIGATTENPSFSLNSALLSRCRVVILEKLSSPNIMKILIRATNDKYNGVIIDKYNKNDQYDKSVRIIIEKQTLQWLADICDGDARIALNSLQIAFQTKDLTSETNDIQTQPQFLSLDNIKDGIKRTHILYDRKGEEHYNIISAMHKSIRASDDNAALYWLTRMLEGGEDPLYIARRLIRIAGEDIGLADPKALNIAVSCMQGCQLIGMPECDVLLAECATYLARAEKSTEVYRALQLCKTEISNFKGRLPSVPLHLRNASTKLMSEIGYGKGYNTLHKDESQLSYMPENMENVCFFK